MKTWVGKLAVLVAMATVLTTYPAWVGAQSGDAAAVFLCNTTLGQTASQTSTCFGIDEYFNFNTDSSPIARVLLCCLGAFAPTYPVRINYVETSMHPNLTQYIYNNVNGITAETMACYVRRCHNCNHTLTEGDFSYYVNNYGTNGLSLTGCSAETYNSCQFCTEAR